MDAVLNFYLWAVTIKIRKEIRFIARSVYALLLVFSACSPRQTPPRGDYFGVLNTGDGRYRLYLDWRAHEPRLTLIGFRGYALPLKRVRVADDSVSFERADMFGAFRGRIDGTSGNINGSWIGEDTLSYPLNFVPARADTIRGLHPRTTSRYKYQVPPALSDHIPAGNRGNAAMSPLALDSIVRDLMRMRYGYVHSMLIARNDSLVIEEYFFEYPREAHFGIQSATKSFVSALAGIAIARGEIPGTQAQLCDYIPGHQHLVCNAKNRTITIAELMTMSTGLAWDEVTYEYGHPKNSAMIAASTGDELRYLFTRPRSSRKQFAYNSLNHTIMNHVLKQSTGLDNALEIETRILGPLGITEYDLGEGHDGIIGDIFLRPRDMLKFGLMYLNNGQWNGQQVVPAEWVRESTSKKVHVKSGLDYGYFWWITSFSWNGRRVPSYFAWGYGGQYIFIVPDLRLVVVFNGTNWSTDPQGRYMELVGRIVGSCEVLAN